MHATPEDIRNRLMQARLHTNDGDWVLIPILSLLNHSFDGLLFQRDEGLFIEGRSQTEEVLVSYGPKDSLHLLANYGFSIHSPFAYSHPLSLQLENSIC